MTDSEILFKRYLIDHGFPEFEHEPNIPGTPKRPDYRVIVQDEPVFFEVKEFELRPPMQDVGIYEPYKPILEKINEAQKQLKALKGKMCAIVLVNPNNAMVFLDKLSIYGAMLGRFGWTVSFGSGGTAKADDSKSALTFLEGGKMIRYKRGEPIGPQNTTVASRIIPAKVL